MTIRRVFILHLTTLLRRSGPSVLDVAPCRNPAVACSSLVRHARPSADCNPRALLILHFVTIVTFRVTFQTRSMVVAALTLPPNSDYTTASRLFNAGDSPASSCVSCSLPATVCFNIRRPVVYPAPETTDLNLRKLFITRHGLLEYTTAGRLIQTGNRLF